MHEELVFFLNQDEFIAKVDKILRETAPNFAWGKVWTIGFKSGHLTPEDFARSAMGLFPKWMTDRLLEQTEVKHADLIDVVELQSGYNARLQPPKSQLTFGSLTREFVSTEFNAEPVIAARGGVATHFLDGSRNLLWGDQGVYRNVSQGSSHFIFKYLRDLDAKHLPGSSLLAVSPGSDIYVHWMFDTLPRILLLLDNGWNISEFDHFVFLNTSQTFHAESLQRLGLSQTQVHICDASGKLIGTDNFCHVSWPRNYAVAHPKIYDLVRAFFGVESVVKNPTRRIFISRSNSKRRRILNEDAFLEKLRPLGFEPVCLEDLSVVDQAALFSEASHVVAPHGAGLGNVVFAPPGTRVLEMFSAFITTEYWSICNQMGHDYFAFECMGESKQYLKQTDLEDIGGMFRRNGHHIHVPVDDAIDYIKGTFLT